MTLRHERPADDRIAITLRAEPGTSFDTAEIEACLASTVGNTRA